MERAVANGFRAPTSALSLGNGSLITTTLSFLSSRAKPRDLQFRGPFLAMFSTVLGGVFGGFRINGGQTVLLHAIDQGATADVEVAGGLGLVSIEFFQGTAD